MKKLSAILALMLCISVANAQTGAKNMLYDLLGSGANSNTVTSIIENVVGGAVSKLNTSVTGTWTYSQPEVQFKSDNLLAKAGGAATTAKIESTLVKVYGKIGINESLTYTFNQDNTFTQTIKIGSTVKKLNGKYSLDKTNMIVTLQYSAIGNMSLGKMNAIYANTGTSLALLFDASEMMSFLKKIINSASSITGKASLSTVSTLLDKYDGVLIGYKMDK